MNDKTLAADLEPQLARSESRARLRTWLLTVPPLAAGAGLAWLSWSNAEEARHALMGTLTAIDGKAPALPPSPPIAALLQQIDTRKGDLDRLRQLEPEYAATKASLEKELAAARSDGASLQQELALARRETDAQRELAEKSTGLQAKIAELEQAASASQEAMAAATTERQSSQTTLADLQAKLDAAIGERDGRSVESRDLSKALAERESELAAARDRVSVLVGELAAAAAAVTVAPDATVSSAEPAVPAEVTAELRAAEQAAAEATARADGLATSVTERERQVADLRTQVDVLTAERDAIRADVATVDQLKQAQSAAESERSTLDARIATLEKELADTRAKAAEAQAAFMALQGEQAELRTRIGGLEGELTDARARADTGQNDLLALQGQRDELTRRLDVAVAAGATSNQRVETLEKDRLDLAERLRVAGDSSAMEQLQAQQALAPRITLEEALQQITAREQQLGENDRTLTAELATLRGVRDDMLKRSQETEQLRQQLAAAEANGDAPTAARVRGQLASAANGADDPAKLAALEASLGRQEQALADLQADEADAKVLRARLEQLQTAVAAAEQPTPEQLTALAEARALVAAGTRPSGVGQRFALASRFADRGQLMARFMANVPGVAEADIVEGDTITLPSTLLFASGQTEISKGGQAELLELANRLKAAIAALPPDRRWLLRVDGHTDDVPVTSGRLRSNWELSAARAISVAEFLVAQGLPADRIVAAGLAEHQPLVDGTDEVSRSLNRRIEIKLSTR